MKIYLTAVFVLMLVIVCYGQLYEPEHLWHLCGEETAEWFGHDIAVIGDVNGDGCEDFMVDAMYNENQVKLFYGGDPPDTTVDMVFNNPLPYGWFGFNVENIGDVNGDNNDDVAIWGRYMQVSLAKVYIYFGGAMLDTIPDVVLSEMSYSDLFGYTIESVGDVNGDGYDDVAVHANIYYYQYGKVWIYFGGSPMDSIADWEYEGSSQNGNFGRSIAGQGDLNGDNYDDVAIYEWTGYPNQAETNYYIFFGNTEFDTIPDIMIYGEDYYPEFDLVNSSALVRNLNGDAFSDLVISGGSANNVVVFYGSDSVDTEIDLVLEGFDPYPQADGVGVSGVGDVNRDGYGDIIASQLGGDTDGSVVLVFLGSPWMDGQPDMEWWCWGTPWEGCGRTKVVGGDINGDGIDDIIWGAYDDFHTEGCVDIWLGDTTFVVNVPEETQIPIPYSFQLFPPYPNPFNSQLTIPLEVFPGMTDDLSLKIYNILGEEIADLTLKALKVISSTNSGEAIVTWNAKDIKDFNLSSGLYFVELRLKSSSQVEKVVLLR